MWDSRIDELLKDGKFCRHDGVVLRGKHCVYALCHQGIRCRLHLRRGRTGLLHIGDSLLIAVCLCVLNRTKGGSLALIIEQSDLCGIRICRQHQIKNRCRVDGIRRSCNIGTRCVHICRQSGAHRIRHCGKYNRNLILLGRTLHHDCGRRRNRDNQIHIIRHQIRCNLCQDRLICLPVERVIRIIKGNSELCSLCCEFRFNRFFNLI